MHFLLVLLIFATPSVFGAQIIAVLDYSTTFAGSGLTFQGISDGSRSASMGVTTGSPSGSANGFGSAATTNPQANVVLNITAGPGSSVTGAFADAFSGVVRVTNPNGSPQSVSLNQTMFYSLISAGPDSASLSMLAAIQRFNTQTNQWTTVQFLSLALGTNQTNGGCSPACTPTDKFDIDGNSTADFRLFSHLTGDLSQGANVPEPSTWTLVVVAAAGLVIKLVSHGRAF